MTATAVGLMLAVTAPAAPPILTLEASGAVIGDPVQATAQLSESPDADGEISFEIFGPGNPICAGAALTPAPDPASVSGEGEYESGEFTPSTVGTYRWSAHYDGGSENEPADSECTAISIVAKATPEIAATASDGVVGSEIHDEASVSGGSSPSGNVTFSVFGPGDSNCATPLATTAVPLQSGEAAAPDFLAQQAGEFRWTASYDGDADNEAVGLGCGAPNQSSSVGKASPGLSGTATATATVGQTITDSATLTAGFSASGQIVFRAYGPGDLTCAKTPAYEQPVAVSGNGAYAPAGFVPGPGVYRWTAAYSGDANNETADTSCGATNQRSTVSKATPTLSGTATAAAVVGQTIGDSATLSAGFSPGGQLVFRAYGPGDASCSKTPAEEQAVSINGNGTYAPPGFGPGPGTYRWTVEYEGDDNNEAVSTDCGDAGQSSTVSKAAPGLVGTATASAVVGQTITDSATISGGFSPGGKLTFRAFGPTDLTCSKGDVYEQEVAVVGNGSYAPAGFVPGPGTYRWTVEYSGDPNNEEVDLDCGAANQASTVSKASPALTGTATSAPKVGLPIGDGVTLAGGFTPGGQLLFRAYGPGDQACATLPAFEDTVAVSGNGPYSTPGFAPPPGLYRWTVEYSGDANNNGFLLGCGATDQASAVGTISVAMAVGATGGTVGTPIQATATISEGAIPSGQVTFSAFPPGDTACSGAPAFRSTATVKSNGQYRSEAFVPTRVGSFRWTVSYGGDGNHAPATAGCGKATSDVAQAKPSIAGAVPQRVMLGTPFRDTATLSGGYAPGGTVTFRIYGPVAGGCAKPAFVNTVATGGSSTVSSDPFSAPRPGRYSFVATYSGDAANLGATEACDSASQVVVVQKRTVKVKPRALLEGRLITIRARLSGGVYPSGRITFRLYGPNDKRCKRKPAFSGATTVKANGSFALAQYLVTRRGIYRLSVGYSGDSRNQRLKASCTAAQSIRVG